MEKEKARGLKKLRRIIKEEEAISKKFVALKLLPNYQPSQPSMVDSYFLAASSSNMFLNYRAIRRPPYEAPIEEDTQEYDKQFNAIVADIVESFGWWTSTCNEQDVTVRNLQRAVTSD